MGTKLRKFSRNNGTKGMVSFLIVVITICISLQISFASGTGVSFDTYNQKIFTESDLYESNVRDAMNSIIESHWTFFQRDNKLIEYYYQKGSEVSTNVEVDVKNVDSKEVTEINNLYRTYFKQFNNNFYSFKNGVWRNGITEKSIVDFNDHDHAGSDLFEITAYLGFSPNYFDLQQKNLELSRKSFLEHWITAGILLLVGCLLVFYLILVAGRRHEDNNIHLIFIDKIYSDVLIITYLLFSSLVMDVIWQDITSYNEPFELMLVLVPYAIISLMVVLSITRKVNAKILIKQSFIYKISQLCFKIGKDIYQYLFSNLYRNASQTKILYLRQLIVCVVTGVSLLFSVIFAFMESPLLLIILIIFVGIIYWYIKGNAYLYLNIDKGIEESLEEQMKSERMKIALITNVSHDLKTPLTSIISYVDLLSKEEELTDTAVDYIKILQIKSDRLKNIVTDLFELAKSTSGNITLEEELIDLKRLTEQTLADMEDKIQESELQFKTSLPDSPVVIKSDGKKLYRVFQNIIDNALKYSLKNTRVYINLERVNQSVVITFKNIAAYEMNFTQEEILQRFYRGDQSRATEGSGLGLSIAESFTNNCGGKLAVEIDGDVFKVIITFSLD